MLKHTFLACCLLGCLVATGQAAIRFELPQVVVITSSTQPASGFFDVVVRVDTADLPQNVSSFNVDFHTTSASLSLGPPQAAPSPLLAGAVSNFSPNAQTIRAARDIFPSTAPLFDGAGLIRVPFQTPVGVSGVFPFAFGSFNELTNANATPLSIQTTDVGSVAVSLAPSGDYNLNGIVDAADYVVWRNTLGSTTILTANGDNTGASAGRIDAADYVVWSANFGHTSGSGNVAFQTVPEPSGRILFLLLAAGFPPAMFRQRTASL